jgi:hypothetical protein
MTRRLAFVSLFTFTAACTEENPQYCATATDCEAGQACDLSTMTCVAAALTLDSTGFFVADDDRWWTVMTGPELRGTVDDPSNPTIQAFVGGSAVGLPATISGDAWSLRLPDGTLTADGVSIVIRLEAGDRTIELAQTLVGDVDGPALALAASAQVIDERGDAVDFSSGMPHHDHLGPAVALGTGCPDVYKHAYLLEPTPEGTEVAANPLRFPAEVTDLAPIHATAEYRVRLAGGVELQTWTAGGAGVDVAAGLVEHPIDLVRTVGIGTPELATYEGELEVDIRITDWAGRQAMSTWCWTHHPLAAPLEVGPAGEAPGGMSDWLLQSDPPLSQLLNVDGTYAPVIDAPFTQYTSDIVYVDIDLTPPSPAGSWAKTIVDDYILVGTEPGEPIACIPDTGAPCPTTLPPRPDPLTNGPLGGSLEWTVLLYEGTGYVGECTSIGAQQYRCTVPGRAGGAPRPFRIAAAVRNLHDLRPNTVGATTPPYAENTLLGLTYSGKSLGVSSVCSSASTCAPMNVFERIVAVDEAAVNFNAITMGLSTTADPSIPAASPAYLPPTVSSAASWNGGNDDLPGSN